MKPPSTPGTSWLRSRMFANVPRIITSWLPRRDPYELKSLRSTPCSVRYRPAGESGLIEPAGEMWSVVTESPSLASTRAPAMSATGVGDGGHAVEVRRLADVRRVLRPRECLAGRCRQRRPSLVSGVHIGVVLGEHLRRDRRVDDPLHLVRRRPDVAQVHRHPVRIVAQGLPRQVDVHRARDRVRHHQWRRGQVVHLHVGVDPALEVPVARQHRHHREVLRLDRGRDLLRQGSGVPDARGAPVPDEVEAQLFQVRNQAGLLVVVHDHFGPRRQARLDPRLGREAALDRLLREQCRPDHHLRIGRVRARRDRGDHDHAVVDVEAGAVLAASPASDCAPVRSWRGRSTPAGPRRGSSPRPPRPRRCRSRSRAGPRGTPTWHP